MTGEAIEADLAPAGDRVLCPRMDRAIPRRILCSWTVWRCWWSCWPCSQWDELPTDGGCRPANVRRGETGGDDPILGSDARSRTICWMSCGKIGKRDDPWLPTWAAMVLLVREGDAKLGAGGSRAPSGALEDPEAGRLPVRHPGLHESETIWRRATTGPKSLGGTNDPPNLSAVCHAHHHARSAQGTDPDRWEGAARIAIRAGCRADGPPMMILRGNKIVKGAFEPEL